MTNVLFKRSFFCLQQDTCNEKAGQYKEDIYAYPTKLKRKKIIRPMPRNYQKGSQGTYAI